MLRNILPAYYDHMMNNPDTLVTRFFGLHSLIQGREKMTFVVMGNVFHQQKPIQQVFDLKGSTINRSTPMNRRGPGMALKDLDFLRKLPIPAEIRLKLVQQINIDSKLLSGLNINDYSFLLGIHTSVEGAVGECPPGVCPPPMHSAFQQYWGGVPSKDGKEVFFVGIIDILTNYEVRKMGEHLVKSILHEAGAMSCVPPPDYHVRFVRYMESIME